MKISIYVGIDGGGTRMTAATVDREGRLVAVYRGAGANPFATATNGPAPAQLVGDALDHALARSRADTIGGVVVGLAGAMMRPDAESAIAAAVLARAAVRPRLVNDAETTFAAGSAEADGYVLVAGTGAIALAIRDHAVAARADGHGWLLGDQGSGVWIGFAAIRAVLGALDGRLKATTSLAEEIPGALADLAGHPCGLDPREIVVTAHELTPAAIGRLAPLVDRHASRGDPVARDILRSAARALGATLAAVIEGQGGRGDLPVVLGGSVAHDNPIVRRSLERSIRRRWPGPPAQAVRDGAVGAALWARRLDGHDYDDRLLLRLRREIETSVLDASVRK